MSDLSNKRIIFAGTPDFAAVHLQKLLDSGIRPVAVYTQPDRPAGRGKHLTPTEVKKLALENDLTVRCPENFRNESDIKEFEELNADLCIVVAYGIILPERVINAPKFGCINVHGSILPKYRGAAPIQRALLDGLETTGVTIQRVVKKVDAGDVYATATTKITDTDTSGTLFDRLAMLGADTLVSMLDDYFEGNLEAHKQEESLATYASKITKEEAEIDFSKTAREVDLKIRGMSPWPVATAMFESTKFKVFECRKTGLKSTKEAGCIESVDKDGINIACSDEQIKLVTV
ncbi:MAG: methionyl-tRNA formyltransferase, partial [Succinivibrio sp.]